MDERSYSDGEQIVLIVSTSPEGKTPLQIEGELRRQYHEEIRLHGYNIAAVSLELIVERATGNNFLNPVITAVTPEGVEYVVNPDAMLMPTLEAFAEGPCDLTYALSSFAEKYGKIHEVRWRFHVPITDTTLT